MEILLIVLLTCGCGCCPLCCPRLLLFSSQLWRLHAAAAFPSLCRMQMIPCSTHDLFAVDPCPRPLQHGDIGIIGPHDLLVCFSKSGATEEIIRLVPFAKVRAEHDVHAQHAVCGRCVAHTRSLSSCPSSAQHCPLPLPCCLPFSVTPNASQPPAS